MPITKVDIEEFIKIAEWKGNKQGAEHPRCPMCGGLKPYEKTYGIIGEHVGHRDFCYYAKASGVSPSDSA